MTFADYVATFAPLFPVIALVANQAIHRIRRGRHHWLMEEISCWN